MPLAAEIRAVHDSRPVRRKIWPCFPVGFLVVNFPRCRSWFRLHAPKAARSVNVAAIRDKQDFPSVPRPHRTDFHVVCAVVVARKGALGLSSEAYDIFELPVAQIGAKNVEPFVVRRRNKNNLFSVGRPARLEIDGAAGGKLPGFPRREVEQPQLHRALLIRNVYDALAVGRPIGLVVVPWAIGELVSVLRTEFLPPQRTS